MKKNDEIFFLAYGFFVWLLATISYKYIGLDQNLMTANFIALLLVMPIINTLGYKYRKTSGSEKYKASALFAFSGLFLDSFIVLFYDDFLSWGNLTLMPDRGAFLGAWLLFGNSITFLTAYISEKLERQKLKKAMN